LKRWGVGYADSIAAFFSERLSDLLAIVILALFGLSLYPEARPLIYLGAALALVLLAALASRRLLLRLKIIIRRYVGRGRKILGHMFDVLLKAQRCQQPTLLLLTTALSVVGWLAEALAFYLILLWIGADVPFAFAAFVFSISMLAGALSFTPGGLGSTEGVMAALLLMNGIESADAIGATVLIRVTTLWFAVAIGIVSASVTIRKEG
jgi:uncharacterized protein (TIRG00374 family)